jgi:hypothetical protein
MDVLFQVFFHIRPDFLDHGVAGAIFVEIFAQLYSGVHQSGLINAFTFPFERLRDHLEGSFAFIEHISTILQRRNLPK